MVLRSRKYKKRVKSSGKQVIEDTRRLVQDVRKLTSENQKDMMKAIHHHLLVVAEINGLIADCLDPIRNDNKKMTYLASSLFLMDSFELLNQREVESLHFVTGPQIGETRVLDRIVDFRHEKQSAVYAKADTNAVREALIYLSRYEFRLWGCFHIHPGFGAYSTFPSGTDMTLDRLLDRGGYECIGAIFSRDGYVRFFSSKAFEINIYGNGVEKVDEKVFRLVKVN